MEGPVGPATYVDEDHTIGKAQMKYFATVKDQTYEIDIEHHGRITVDGVELTADMQLVEADTSTRCWSTTPRTRSSSTRRSKGATSTAC